MYDKFGRTTANRVGNGNAWRTLSELEYNGAGLLSKQTYGNGDTVEFSYDKFDRQTEKRYNGSENQRVTYSYGSNGSVAQITDFFTGTNTKFVYDLAERVVSQREYAGTGKSDLNLISYTDFKYADKTNYLTGITHFSPLGRQEIGYAYGSLKNGEMPDQVYSVQWNGSEKLGFAYDNLGRLAQKDFGGNSFGIKYAYENYEIAKENGAAEKRTTTLVKSVETPAGTYSYEYDKLGNIISVANGTTTVSYEYDSLNQLTRVNDEKAGKTITYSYTNGNITEQKEYEYTTGELGEPTDTKTWSYTDSVWSDLLTDFNGTQIAYDEIGNPLSIGSKQLTWLGRQLQSIADGENTIEYAYNGDGNRISKTVNGVKTEFVYNGDILAGQKSGNDTLVFMYDNNSDVFGFVLNGTEYYYIKNAQNDVTAIADESGNVLANYAYDAWGKVTEITGNTALAEQNPIRYRSYYFDFETGFYYVSSRYYDPEIGRWINADNAIAGVGGNIRGYNLFAYCMNDPVNMSDHTGHWPQWIKKAASAVVNAVKKAVTVANTVKSAVSSASNILKASSKSLPKKGKPGSSRTLPNPDGTPKQKRWYGPDGNPERDRDYNHPGNMPFPHDHEWKNGERGKEHLPPDPSYKISWEPVIGAGLVVICTVGIIAIAADDLTGVGVADDFLFGPLGAGVGEGLIMIFG